MTAADKTILKLLFFVTRVRPAPKVSHLRPHSGCVDKLALPKPPNSLPRIQEIQPSCLAKMILL